MPLYHEKSFLIFEVNSSKGIFLGKIEVFLPHCRHSFGLCITGNAGGRAFTKAKASKN